MEFEKVGDEDEDGWWKDSGWWSGSWSDKSWQRCNKSDASSVKSQVVNAIDVSGILSNVSGGTVPNSRKDFGKENAKIPNYDGV